MEVYSRMSVADRKNLAVLCDNLAAFGIQVPDDIAAGDSSRAIDLLSTATGVAREPRTVAAAGPAAPFAPPTK